MTHYERAFTFSHYFVLSRCPLVAAPGAVLEAPGWDQQLWEALPSLFLRQHPQPKEAAAGRARVPAGTEHPSEPGALHPSLTLWAQLNKGSSNSWLCWCSTTLLRKLIAGLKQGSSTHCRADQMIPHLEEMSCAYVDCNTQNGMVCPELFFQRWLASLISKILFRRGILVTA